MPEAGNCIADRRTDASETFALATVFDPGAQPTAGRAALVEGLTKVPRIDNEGKGLLASLREVLDIFDHRPPDTGCIRRAAVSETGETVELRIYDHDDLCGAVALDPAHAVALATRLIEAAQRRLTV